MTDAQPKNQSSLRTERLALIAAVAGVAVCALAPELAWAYPWDDGADKTLSILNGRVATVSAIIAVMVVGFLSFKGRIPWGWALSVIGGIVLVFGAPAFVSYFRP